MTIKETEQVDLPTTNGPMRTYVFRPTAAGKYPGLVLFSKIFQIATPIGGGKDSTKLGEALAKAKSLLG